MPYGSKVSASRSSEKSGGRLPTKILPLLLRTHMQSACRGTPAGFSPRCDAQSAAVNTPARYGTALLQCNDSSPIPPTHRQLPLLARRGSIVHRQQPEEPMIPRERAPYSAIVDRPALKLP